MRHKFLLMTILLALVGLSGCGDGGAGGESEAADDSLEPPYINYHEHDFALHRRWRATADDLVVVHLEDPAAPQNGPDTEGPGVDAIPVVYFDTTERTYCWDGDPSNTGHSGRRPHSLSLVDQAGDEVLRLAEDESCATQEIPAGDYRMVFTYGDGSGNDRDILFVLPGGRGPLLTTDDADVSPKAGESATVADPAATPVCAIRSAFDDPTIHSGEAWMGRSVYDRGMQSFGGVQTLTGPCQDVRLVTNRIAPTFPDGTQFIFGPMASDTFVRVYHDPNFRGARIPIKVLGSDYRSFARFVLPPEPFEFPEFLGYIGSAMPEIGVPAGNKETLISTNHCDHCNLESVDLHGRDLSNVSLRQANLSHAELSDATLNGVHAEGALFQSANLPRAKFFDAFLQGASFESAGPIPFSMTAQVYPAADLSSAKFGRAAMSGASLIGANLDHADFTSAHLEDADLSETGLTSAVFTDAIMDRALLTKASGHDVILTRAKLPSANLQGALLPGAKMEGAVLTKAVLARDPERGLEACQLSHAYMAYVDMSSAEATGVNLSMARFYGRSENASASAAHAVLINADLNGSELSGTNFSGAFLQNAIFDGAKCINCKFNTARMAATSSTTMDGAKFGGASLMGADFTQATVTGCVFTNAIVSFTNGTYTTGGNGEAIYTALYGPTLMGEVATSSSVICPDGLRGPCNTPDRLKPHGATPTRAPTRTPPPTWTPGGDDPFATPTRR
jgi:uncharacterized protein YjbI with pentapeptide repeats